jgi:hypothetical protein
MSIYCFYNIYDEWDELIIPAESMEEAYYIAGYDYVLEDVIEERNQL